MYTEGKSIVGANMKEGQERRKERMWEGIAKYIFFFSKTNLNIAKQWPKLSYTQKYQAGARGSQNNPSGIMQSHSCDLYSPDEWQTSH